MKQQRSPPHSCYVLPSDIAGVQDLWSLTTGHPSIRIAILDGPVDARHQAFAGIRVEQVDVPPFSYGATRTGWAARHGTHVASVIFGQHDGPIKGIAPRCTPVVVPIFRDRGKAIAPVSQLDLSRAIMLAVARGADIINISAGEADPTGAPTPFLADALAVCEKNAVLVVAAAGNDGRNDVHVPAAHPTVLVVGATGGRGEILSMTNWSDRHSIHGVLAPGENIVGARSGGGLALGTGTSYATAIVTGVAGLLLSLRLRHRPTVGELRDTTIATWQATLSGAR